MSFKIVFFAAAVFACQANAQLSLVRPFATGFSNGISEMAKPFIQLGQSAISPASDYFQAVRPRPQVAQWMSYPAQAQNMIPQAQAAAYEGFDALTSGMPGASFIQVIRPRPFRPQFFPAANPAASIVPPRPYPAPVPAPAPVPVPAPAPVPSSSSSSEEDSDETYVPSNLLVEEAAVPAPAPVPTTVEAKPEIPALQRPFPVVEDEEQ